MMKTLGLVLVLLCVLSGSVVADTAEITIFAGWNRLACPIVPFDPAPESTFGDLPVNRKLFRIDAASQSEIVFDSRSPEEFGNILLGDGYHLEAAADGIVVVDGVADGVPSGDVPTDMWISLPGDQLTPDANGGWHLIGHPFAHDTPVNISGKDGGNVLFTDGTVTLTWPQAVTAGWVERSMFGMEGGSEFTVGYDRADYDYLQAGRGYYIYTKKNNIAMIIDGQAGYEQ